MSQLVHLLERALRIVGWILFAWFAVAIVLSLAWYIGGYTAGRL